jgi:hypothetical protein
MTQFRNQKNASVRHCGKNQRKKEREKGKEREAVIKSSDL